MANLTIDDNQFKYSHNTTQAGTHNITLNTENKFVDKDIVLSITTTAAQTAADTATATITVDTATGTNANNVRGIISATSTRPTENTAYYLSFIASGGGNSKVTRAGWISVTSANTSTTSTNYYYVLTKATGGVSNNVAASSTVAITTGNVATTSTNNGIYIQSVGTSTASGSITASSTAAGYFPPNTVIATGSVNKTASSTATTYISGVTVPNTTFTVTASSNTAGTIKVAAFASNTATSRDALQTVVTNGVWTTNTITPGTANKGPYYGKTTVIGDAELVPANIKHNINIFGVTGTFTSDGSITAGVVLDGYIGYSKGTQYIGTMANRGALNKTIPIQGGTVTVTAGYYSGGTITAQLPTTSITQQAWSKNETSKVITTNSTTWGVGYVSTSGNVDPVTFSNSASSGVTYIDLTDARVGSATGAFYLPEATSAGYIYINRGYIDNVMIDIGRFIPDFTDTAHAAGENQMLKGFHAYDGAGNVLTGNIDSLAATTYNVSSSNQTIAAGKYLSGAQTIRAVTTSGITAANIVYNKTIKVGDSADDDRIISAVGTFSHTSTITGSKTAVVAAALRSGYAAFIDGGQINGTMPNTSAAASFTNSGINTYFTTTNSGGNVTITPDYSVTTAGYIAVSTAVAGAVSRYNIKTTSLSAKSGDVTLQSDTTAYSSTTPTLPFSIYSSSTTRNIAIVTATTTATMGTNRVYIKIQGTGSVAASTTGWLGSTAAVNSTTVNKYLAMDYYTGIYSISNT